MVSLVKRCRSVWLVDITGLADRLSTWQCTDCGRTFVSWDPAASVSPDIYTLVAIPRVDHDPEPAPPGSG